MGLYLAIFDGDEEVDGVEVGSYDDFAWLRATVVESVEGGNAGARCPTLVMHSDCDGEWSPSETASLESELHEIEGVFKELPPVPFNSEWQVDMARTFGVRPTSLYDCFLDVDAEPLIERLIGLARTSQQRQLPILFQ